MSMDTTTPETVTGTSSDSPTAAGTSAPSSTAPAPRTTSEHPEPPKPDEPAEDTDKGRTPDANPSEAEPQDPDSAEGDQQEEDGAEEVSSDAYKLRREAKRHRLKLREAEAERDAAVAKLHSLAEVVLGDQLARHGLGIEALRAAGHDPAGFFNANGEYDAEAVDAAARATAAKFGLRPAGGVSKWAGTGPERTPSTGWRDIISDPLR